MQTSKTDSRNKDAGLALLLILLLAAWFLKKPELLQPAIFVLVIAMSIPICFKPFALIWFGFSTLLGIISSRIILTLLFLLVVIPVGLIRRMIGADPLQMAKHNQNKSSAFNKTNHRYQKKDLMHPY